MPVAVSPSFKREGFGAPCLLLRSGEFCPTATDFSMDWAGVCRLVSGVLLEDVPAVAVSISGKEFGLEAVTELMEEALTRPLAGSCPLRGLGRRPPAPTFPVMGVEASGVLSVGPVAVLSPIRGAGRRLATPTPFVVRVGVLGAVAAGSIAVSGLIRGWGRLRPAPTGVAVCWANLLSSLK